MPTAIKEHNPVAHPGPHHRRRMVRLALGQLPLAPRIRHIRYEISNRHNLTLLPRKDITRTLQGPYQPPALADGTLATLMKVSVVLTPSPESTPGRQND
jgi:hypothetical protein